MVNYIIEHLEEKLWDWCLFEYEHISELVGKSNVLFTHVTDRVLEKFGTITRRSVVDMKLKNACILDPDAPVLLTPALASTFDTFVFGGILGNDPPEQRTGPELTSKMNLPVFNIGKKQMSTDTAVYVVKQIVDGKEFDELKFVDTVEIELDTHESTVLPYRYVVVDGKPWMSSTLVAWLKKQDGL